MPEGGPAGDPDPVLTGTGDRMRWKGWEHVPLEVPDPGMPGSTCAVDAIAPLIVSASRSTDIPAFYGDWLMARLRAGYVKWKSPFGGKPVYVSFEKARLFVFWSKDPAPFMRHLDTLDREGYGCYFLYTLNNYGPEGLEPGVPSLDERIGTFIRLSRRIGKGKVVWRYDPLVLSDTVEVATLLGRIEAVGDRIHPFCERLIFSFVDIQKYAKVKRNLERQGLSGIREFTEDEVRQFCKGIASLSRRWNLAITACGEGRDLSAYGIGKGQCISYDLISREFAGDRKLMDFLHSAGIAGQKTLAGAEMSGNPARWLKDPGQRNACGCIASKDIGQYSTCMHLCAYCYANSSPTAAAANYRRFCDDARRGIFHDSITGRDPG